MAWLTGFGPLELSFDGGLKMAKVSQCGFCFEMLVERKCGVRLVVATKGPRRFSAVGPFPSGRLRSRSNFPRSDVARFVRVRLRSVRAKSCLPGSPSNLIRVPEGANVSEKSLAVFGRPLRARGAASPGYVTCPSACVDSVLTPAVCRP